MDVWYSERWTNGGYFNLPYDKIGVEIVVNCDWIAVFYVEPPSERTQALK